jgi:hypothetical protein
MNWELLRQPFAIEHIEFKIETKSKDGARGQASAYVDPRRYQERLDDCFGEANWSVEYRLLKDQSVIARIVVVDPETGKTTIREDVGEFDLGGRSEYPVATAQAFKRACTALGLGRYLYFLPRMWGQLENNEFPESELKRFREMMGAKPRPAQPTPARSYTNTTPAKPHSSQYPVKSDSTTPPRSQPNPAIAQKPRFNRDDLVNRIDTLLIIASDNNVSIEHLDPNWKTKSDEDLIIIGQRLREGLGELAK